MSTKTRGFASMTPERRREASRQGGLAVHEYGTGRQWTPAEARAANQKARDNRAAHIARSCPARLGPVLRALMEGEE